jgi:hypothetical protein
MTFRGLRASLAILVLILVTPGQAHAALEWPSASICTQVERLGGYTDQWSSTESDYIIFGTVGACPGADDPQARWTVVRYQTGTPGVWARPMPYREPGQQGYNFRYERRASPGAWAACVVNHVQPTEADALLSTANRVACVGPDPAGPSTPTGPVPTGPNGPVLRTPLVPVPIDDPRFDGALLAGETGGSGYPACAGCV